MKLCPIAIAVGCKKCLLFDVCFLKTIIGDYKKEKDKDNEKTELIDKRSK